MLLESPRYPYENERAGILRAALGPDCKVVDLAVEDDAQLGARLLDWLMRSQEEIGDGKPSMPKPTQPPTRRPPFIYIVQAAVAE